jgi:PAS domain S-box-containing protein
VRPLLDDATAHPVIWNGHAQLVVDDEGIIREVSEQAKHPLAHDAGELLGRSLADFSPHVLTDDVNNLEPKPASVEVLLAMRLPACLALSTLSGERIEVAFSSQPLLTPSGRRYLCVLLVIKDALLTTPDDATRQLFVSLLGALPNESVIVDEHGAVVACSPGSLRILAPDRDEVGLDIVGKRLDAVVTELFDARAEAVTTSANTTAIIAGGIEASRTTFAVTSRMMTRWIECSGKSMWHAGRRFVVFEFLDITPLMSEVQRNGLARFILEALYDGVIATDADAVIQQVNPACRRMYGIAADALIGRNLFSVIETDFTPVSRAAALATIHEQGVFHGRVRQKVGDGAWLSVEMSVGPLLDTAGRCTGFVFLNHDVTQVENLLAKNLDTERLRMLGLFSARVAHDFNNVLSTISLSAESLTAQSNPIPPELVDIIEACGQGGTLTKDLMNAARGDDSAPELCDVAKTTRTTCRLMLRMFSLDVDMRFDVVPNLPPVMMKPGRLGQILMNLLSNAHDALGSSAGVIDVTARGEGDRVIIEVADNGQGIVASDLQRVTEPFFTTKARSKGVGLGLATVARVIEEAGGRFSLRSTVGVGTVATIDLPAWKPVESPAAE